MRLQDTGWTPPQHTDIPLREQADWTAPIGRIAAELGLQPGVMFPTGSDVV
ncbi:MAG: hypothetical protein GY913_34595 [Proteobacteria bacterium]|nr:hypothetical protein [Pseudomonadota bacterium]MCP4922060.1 hypothetical protein [Pseudomonadota bacterium]